MLYGKHVEFTKKKGKILSSYTENTLYCSDVYNLAQKLDNSVQIVKITGELSCKYVVLKQKYASTRVTLTLGLPSFLVNRALPRVDCIPL